MHIRTHLLPEGPRVRHAASVGADEGEGDGGGVGGEAGVAWVAGGV